MATNLRLANESTDRPAHASIALAPIRKLAMPKKRQIPRLFPRPLANGGTAWDWKPSPKERKQGWKTKVLGTDELTAIAAALDLNKAFESWKAEEGTTPAIGQAGSRATPDRIVRFAELSSRFQQSDDFLGLAQATRREYRSRLGQLETWAMEGTLPVRDLNGRMVETLRKELLTGSRFRMAAILRVLRLVLSFAERENLIPKGSNPARNIRIPETPKRKQRILISDLPWLDRAAEETGLHFIGLGVTLGFYSMQRQSDLLDCTQFRFQRVRDISADAERILRGPDGKVMGLALTQNKTKASVFISLVPPARTALEHRLVANDNPDRQLVSTYLIKRPQDAGRCHARMFNRDWNTVLDRAVALCVAAARAAGHARDWRTAYVHLKSARRLYALQYRDLRRSGMCWLRDMGVPIAFIAANSGHSIKQTEKILDTYLPADTWSAAEGMAWAWEKHNQRLATDEAERRSA